MHLEQRLKAVGTEEIEANADRILKAASVTVKTKENDRRCCSDSQFTHYDHGHISTLYALLHNQTPPSHRQTSSSADGRPYWGIQCRVGVPGRISPRHSSTRASSSDAVAPDERHRSKASFFLGGGGFMYCMLKRAALREQSQRVDPVIGEAGPAQVRSEHCKIDK